MEPFETKFGDAYGECTKFYGFNCEDVFKDVYLDQQPKGQDLSSQPFHVLRTAECESTQLGQVPSVLKVQGL